MKGCESMLEFFTQYSKYVLISIVLSPLLFLLVNQIWLHGKTKQVSLEWRKKERNETKAWSQSEFAPVDKAVRVHLKHQLQGNGILVLAFILNVIAQPLVVILTLGMAPFALWMVTLLLLIARISVRSKVLSKQGLHMNGVIYHERLRKSIHEFAVLHPYISSPYAFLYHYLRLESIPEELNSIIRSSKDARTAKEESEVIGDEERWLMEELRLSFSGRPRYYNQELATESTEAMNRMLRHAKNPELSVDIRKKAMALAKQLQLRAEVESLEEAKELDALLDIETVERFYIQD